MTTRKDRARHLDAYLRAIAPAGDRRARNLEGLRRRLAEQGDASSTNDRARPPRSIVPTAIATSVAIAAAALLLLWGGAGGVRALQEAARAPLHEAPATAERAPSDRSASPAVRRTTGAARPTKRETRSASPLEPRARAGDPAVAIGRGDTKAAPTHATSAASPEDRLREELALVRVARAALQSGDDDEVWRLTQAHAAEYPQGALAHERDAWRALAACRLDRSDAARLFARFLDEHDGSPYTARVRRACETR